MENHLCNIPEKWKQIIVENDFTVKKDRVIKLWNTVAKMELRNTIQYLSDHLVSLDLLYDGYIYSLLYGIRYSDSEVAYYEGQLTLDLDNCVELENRWKDLPKSIQRFYEDIHNGFYYYASHSVGMVPVDEVTHLAEYDWGILEYLEEPLKIDMNSCFGFFSNGMGAYVVIDSNGPIDGDAVLWFKDKKPRYGVDFWDVVDEWIVLGFQF